MATTIQNVLGNRNLLGLVDAILPGLPTVHLPPALLGGATSRGVKGNTGSYIKADGTQRVARHTNYGGSSRLRTVSPVAEQPIVLLSPKESIDIKANVLMNLMSGDGADQRMGESEVARQVREAVQLVQNFRTAAVTSLFGLNGHIYLDGDGNMLGSSSGAVIDVNSNIPAGNLNQLGGIIGTTWATNTTDIVGDMIAIHQLAVQTTGRPLRHAIYGANILNYLLNNDKVKELINNNPSLSSQAASGGIPQGLFGLTWWPGYMGFFRDDAGTAQVPIGGDIIAFLPEPSSDWYEIVEGTEPVPMAGFGVASDLSTLLANVEPRQGQYTYAYGQMDPVGAKMVYGDTFLPVLKSPESVFIADVVP